MSLELQSPDTVSAPEQGEYQASHFDSPQGLWKRRKRQISTDPNTGYTTEVVRTAFGEHSDHVKEFAGGLKEEQKQALRKGDVAAFESSLNSHQLEQWQALKAESQKIGDDPAHLPDFLRAKLDHSAPGQTHAASPYQGIVANFFADLYPNDIGTGLGGVGRPDAFTPPGAVPAVTQPAVTAPGLTNSVLQPPTPGFTP